MAAHLKPFNVQVQSPGELIKEEIEAKKWVQEDLAYVLDISLKHLNEVINNKKSITLELAILLGKVFNKNPQYWLNAELEYRKLLEKSEEVSKEDPVDQKTRIIEKLPINEMFKKFWLEKTNDVDYLIEQVKKFLNNKSELDFTEFDLIKLPPFSTSNAFKESFNRNAAIAWFYKARNSAREFDVPKYDKKGLEQLYNNLHSYTIKKDGIKLFLKELKKTGVKFLFLTHLQKTYLNGAAFFDNKNPVIVYTGRHNRIDNFWFVVAHEVVHILRHIDPNQNNYFINIEDALDNREEEANNLAAKSLLQDEILEYFKNNLNYITEDRINTFSKEKEIHPAVIVGILAFNKIVSFVNLHRFNETVKDKIPVEYMVEKKLS